MAVTLSFSFQSAERKAKIFAEEEQIINNRRKAKKNSFPKQVDILFNVELKNVKEC